ncbi:hypothetical protein CPC08DRAFT_758861 [Agrocybe pediades]|nr:hypothetical protein CPC08DRAFT_758861 [Agrocybe pediades]
MHSIVSLIITYLSVSLVQSAPTGAALDAATLLANGQAAQKLNSQFLTSKPSDSCQDDQIACIDNSIATCVNGQFDASKGKCSKSQTCFALPNVREVGTFLTCTSAKSALSLIEATGATGGITGSDNASSSQNSTESTESTTVLSDEGMEMPCTTASPSATTDAPDASQAVDRVTITVTLLPSQTITLDPVTTTISPEEASSILSSAVAEQKTVATDASSAVTQTPSATVNPITLITLSPTANPITLITLSPTAFPTGVSSAETASANSGGYASGGYGGY